MLPYPTLCQLSFCGRPILSISVLGTGMCLHLKYIIPFCCKTFTRLCYNTEHFTKSISNQLKIFFRHKIVKTILYPIFFQNFASKRRNFVFVCLEVFWQQTFFLLNVTAHHTSAVFPSKVRNLRIFAHCWNDLKAN